MGKAVGVLGVQTHLVQQGLDALLPLLLSGAELVDVQRFAHDLTHGHARVQGSGGILKDDLHFAPVGQHVHRDLLRAVVDGLSVILDAPGGGLVQPDDGASQGGLAAAGLAHQTQGLALEDLQGDGLHGLHVFSLPEQIALDGEVLAEIFDFQKNVAHVGSPFPDCSRKWSQQAEICPSPT